LSELRSAIEAMRSQVLPDLPDARAEEEFAELQAASQLLEAERLRRLVDVERRGLFARDGYLSVTAWLADRFRVAWGVARRSTRVARSLEQMPATRRALAAGDLSVSAAYVLAEAHDSEPLAFGDVEEQLVEAARIHPISVLRRVAEIWREHMASERPGAQGSWDRRGLHASRTLGGMVRVDGDLDPEGGEALMTALAAVMDAEVRSGDEDPRTPAQRKADALHEICRQWLDGVDRPIVAGERPHVTVTVPVEALGTSKAVAELDHVGAVGSEIAERLSCDVSVMRIVLFGASQPLDIGRRTAVVPPAIRRAVAARDRRCRFPGCDRPQTWCDAHHVVHWARGGPTSLANLVLLCRRHHRLVHDRFALAVEDGRPVFRRPDGSVLEDRAPP
jgi:Domain of unknown function (DUF222)/HNH endonuclease